ncbi:MAG: Formate hydrogenlyase transcriptional activator [Syntrophorhabdaceae bacterium PtaU1.Bin034]|nr:MAG: Formate hydrogenlyase transcriptional activator [Syntrophorhabdaceae bacterium PtaU1.Bin034]
MNMDKAVFFQEATLRLCSSLEIETALRRSFDYIRGFIPADGMTLSILDVELNVLRHVASVQDNLPNVSGQVWPLPQKGRSERAIFLKGPETIRIMNGINPALGIDELRERIGLRADISVMSMVLEIEGNRVGNVLLTAIGLDRYTSEHAELLELLREPFAIAMSNTLEHQEVLRLKDMLADDNRYLFAELRSVSGEEIVGADFGLKSVMKMAEQVAPLDSPVLLLGETGTGKEVIANAIHYSSGRKDGPFIKVNCGAIPETLLDSELFGHERGAFTGAVTQKRGRFERANKGTIFLDEIGELPLQAQVRLLRVLENGEIERVGGANSIRVDIRVISATNRNLDEMVASGRFRKDLWFRLNVFPVMIPPLRHRKEDIPALVHHFIEHKSIELKLSEKPVLTHGIMDRIIAYDWPGNVRELQNMIERALIQYQGGTFSFETLLLPDDSGYLRRAQDPGRGRPILSLADINARHIRQALEMAGGKINGPGGAAEILGINPNTLRKRMNKLGILYGRRSWQPYSKEPA